MAVVKFLLKTLVGFLLLLFILVICAIGLGIWSFPKLAPKGIDSWIEGRTGFSATINGVDLKIFSGTLNVDNFALVNPPYYQNKNFMQIKQISVQVEPRSLYRERKVLDLVFIEIDRLTWVKNSQGSINVVEFLNKLRKKSGSSVLVLGAAGVAEKKKKDMDDEGYLIKKFVIRINGMDMIGFPGENDTQNFVLNYSKEFTDVSDVEDVMDQVIEDIKSRGVLDLTKGMLALPVVKDIFMSGGEGVQKGVEKAFRYLQNAVK